MEQQIQSPESPVEQLEFRHADNFVRRYANNVQFELTAWDLTIVFGELRQNQPGQQAGKPIVEQHTSITISWPEVKLLCAYLQVNIAAHELDDGKVTVSPRVFPVPPPIPDEQANNPSAQAIRNLLLKLRDQVLAD